MRRSQVAAAVAGVVALAGAVLVPGTAHADANLTCQGGFANQGTGTYNKVLVPSTANGENFCVLNGATVLRDVSVQAGGAFLIANTSIARNLDSAGAGTATGGSGLTFSAVLCGTTVGGAVSITKSSSLVEVGTDDFATCVNAQHPIGNTLNGVSNTIAYNRGGVEVESNHVNGNLTVNNNSGVIPTNRDFDAAPNESTAVNHNSDSTHQLKCVGNAGVVDSHFNTFQTIIGQCNP